MNDAVDEFRLVRRYLRRDIERADVLLGIDDDAALTRPPAGQTLALAMDTLVDGVHFPADTPAADVGYKALAVNLSDLAAMGAEPAWALLALTLPEADERWVADFASGFFDLADSHGVALVGGDTTRGPLTVTVQVCGFVDRALRRAGAEPGDRVWVSGWPGEAGAGLACWRDSRGGPQARALTRRLCRPAPRLALGVALRGVASAAIDISDGLVADAGHLAEASGVALRLEAEALPLSEALRAEAGAAATALALGAGDDYELCFTAAPERDAEVRAAGETAGVTVTPIGRVTAGRGASAVDASGAILEAVGYRHFGATR